MSRMIDGKTLAQGIRTRLKAECGALEYVPSLVAILVGDDPASHQYVRIKEKACREVGIHFERLTFAADVPLPMLLRAVENLNRRQDVDGILVQLPLPAQLDADAVIMAMDPSKDADGFHPDNVESLRDGHARIIPALPAAIVSLIKSTGEDLRGKTAAVVANGARFYEPLAVVLTAAGLVPALALPDAPALAEKTLAADVVVIAVGRAHFLLGGMVKPGAIVIDVGTNKKGDATVGDVDPAAASVAGHLSPVPGGVGPMTVACLLRNVIDLARARRG